MDKKLLDRRINAARKDRGVTGEKLAEACNINPTYLRQIEAGVKIPSLPMFETLCKELNVSPSYLLADDLPDEVKDMDALFELWMKATPSEIRTISAMVKAALAAMEDEK